jgi:uncharacterized protein YjiS (DUF1127 family)
MNPILHSLQTPAAAALWLAAKDAWRALGQALRRHADAWQRRRQARASLEALRYVSEMNPHLMRDLGIDRGELLSIALYPDDATRARFNLQA